MNSTQRAAVVILAIAAVVLIGWRATACRAAAADDRQAGELHAQISTKTARLAALRAQPPVNGFGVKPTDDVIQLTNRVLGSAGLAASRLRSVDPEGDRPIPDDRDGRRAATARLTLEPVTVQEIGSLLAAWRSTQQVWSVTRIDLSAVVRSNGQYRASITVAATYIDDSAPSPSASPSTSPTPPASSPLLGAAH